MGSSHWARAARARARGDAAGEAERGRAEGGLDSLTEPDTDAEGVAIEDVL
jgi:hypothetical protein